MTRTARPELSIVVPAFNEAESLPALATKIRAALDADPNFEVLFVDDGSTDESWAVIEKQHAKDPRFRGVQLRRNFGKAMALSTGFRLARGDILMMMDADLQDDPEDLPRFVEELRRGLDVVVGWKIDRKDPLSRRIASRIFNTTVGAATGCRLHDMNCGFKAYSRPVIETIPIYGDLFRFIPALAAADGFRVGEIPIRHHPRAFGKSRYGLERILRGFFDLLSVVFLTRYARKPMHLFGLMGLITGALGFCLAAYLTVLWLSGVGIGSRPLLLLSVMLMVMGVQFGSLGFIGEFLTYQNEKRTYSDALPIRQLTPEQSQQQVLTPPIAEPLPQFTP